jgi:hypothetical protein
VLVLAILLAGTGRVLAAPVVVHFPEASLHGFLGLSKADGSPLAQGDLLQSAQGEAIVSRMEFHFEDGSFFQETVTFTQRRVFEVTSYHLVHRGPAFPFDIDATLERSSGMYRSKTKEHGKEREESSEGKLQLPPDAYNGLIPVPARNLSPDRSETVHVVAFTPKPHLIELEIVPIAEQDVLFGDVKKKTVRFRVKPRLGVWLGTFARLLGRYPPDSYIWIFPGEAPAFVRFAGPLYSGPVWRIDLSAPRFPG